MGKKHTLTYWVLSDLRTDGDPCHQRFELKRDAVKAYRRAVEGALVEAGRERGYRGDDPAMGQRYLKEPTNGCGSMDFEELREYVGYAEPRKVTVIWYGSAFNLMRACQYLDLTDGEHPGWLDVKDRPPSGQGLNEFVDAWKRKDQPRWERYWLFEEARL